MFYTLPIYVFNYVIKSSKNHSKKQQNLFIFSEFILGKHITQPGPWVL